MTPDPDSTRTRPNLPPAEAREATTWWPFPATCCHTTTAEPSVPTAARSKAGRAPPWASTARPSSCRGPQFRPELVLVRATTCAAFPWNRYQAATTAPWPLDATVGKPVLAPPRLSVTVGFHPASAGLADSAARAIAITDTSPTRATMA